MKILICGANGNVGKDLVYFLSKKFKIFAIYRNNKNHLLKNKNIKWIKSDLKNEIKLNIKPDYIINCIATHTFSQKRNVCRPVGLEKGTFEPNRCQTSRHDGDVPPNC